MALNNLSSLLFALDMCDLMNLDRGGSSPPQASRCYIVGDLILLLSTPSLILHRSSHPLITRFECGEGALGLGILPMILLPSVGKIDVRSVFPLGGLDM